MALHTLLYCPPLARSEPPLLSMNGSFTPTAAVLSAQQQDSAAQLISLWQQHRVSRYNRYPDATALAAVFVLLVLQQGQALALSRQMLQFAVAQAKKQPGCEVLVCDDMHKAVPAALLSEFAACGAAIKTAENVHHAMLLANSQAVITADSWLGFEALLWQKPVYTFGMPFYAGWGLTVDETPIPRRRRSLTRAQLFAAAMILAPTWYDPCRDRLCSFEEAVDQLEAETRAFREDRAGYVAFGMRAWKRGRLQEVFGRETPLLFAKTAA